MAHISRDFVIGTSLASLGALVVLAVFIGGLTATIKDRRVVGKWDGEFVSLFCGIPLAVLLIVLGGIAYVDYPYHMRYHEYVQRGGVVSAISPRLLGENGNTTQEYPVRFNGLPDTYRCDDSRCALVKVGDELELSCIATYQYAGSDGWRCNFISTVPKS